MGLSLTTTTDNRLSVVVVVTNTSRSGEQVEATVAFPCAQPWNVHNALKLKEPLARHSEAVLYKRLDLWPDGLTTTTPFLGFSGLVTVCWAGLTCHLLLSLRIHLTHILTSFSGFVFTTAHPDHRLYETLPHEWVQLLSLSPQKKCRNIFSADCLQTKSLYFYLLNFIYSRFSFLTFILSLCFIQPCYGLPIGATVYGRNKWGFYENAPSAVEFTVLYIWKLWECSEFVLLLYPEVDSVSCLYNEYFHFLCMCVCGDDWGFMLDVYTMYIIYASFMWYKSNDNKIWHQFYSLLSFVFGLLVILCCCMFFSIRPA